MKYLTSTVALISTLGMAAPALAGSADAPVPEPVISQAAPIVSVGTDWTGAYAGVSLGYGYGGDAADDADGEVYSVFGGYNYDFGDYVIGGELEYGAAELSNGTVDVDEITRLKLKAGYDAGRALVYGVLGATYAETDISGSGFSDTGLTYGLGVDYAVTDSISAGVELLQTEFDEFSDSGADLSATTVGARVSFRF